MLAMEKEPAMFSMKEAAMAHAKAAEKLAGTDVDWLNSNEEVIPIFVNLLFQSVEISIKAFALEAGVADQGELREAKSTRNGHGLSELAKLVDSRMDGAGMIEMLLPKMGFATSRLVLEAMVHGADFAPTRESYVRRNLAYAQFKPGELQVVGGIGEWVEAVKNAAGNIDRAVSTYREQLAEKNG